MLDRRDLLGRAGRFTLGAALVPATARRWSATPSLAALRDRVAGPVIGRAHSDYDVAKRLYSPRFDHVRPLAVVYATSAADVSETVRWARQNGVRIAVRSGGHSYAGYSTKGDGVVIDVSRLDAVVFNADRGTVRIGAGARLMDVYAKLAPHGVTIPAGSCPTVGIAGLALGGGIGFASRKLGLTSDNIVSLTIVTADGVVRPCKPGRNADLLWACKGGGGGSFGVVTSFTFRAHPVGSVATYRATWPWSEAATALRAWQGWAPDAPDALFSMMGLTATDSGQTLIGSQGQFFGTTTQLNAELQNLFAVAGQPATLELQSHTYLDAMLKWANCSEASHCSLGDGVSRSTYAAKSDFFRATMPAAAIAAALDAIEGRAAAPAAGSILFDAYGGAINRVPRSATAFVHRAMRFSGQYIASWSFAGGDPPAAAAISWLRNTRTALRPHASGFAYQNYIDADLATGWGHAYYGANYARLRRVKRRYDPNNVFRFAQSIVPAPA